MNVLPVVRLNGLKPDSLGTYLASIGLLSLAARKWPSVRSVWRHNGFCLVGGPDTLEQTVEFVSEIGRKNTWSRYEKPWDNAKKADVERKTSRQTALWRALEAEERLLPAFGAHLALGDRVMMNPLLGTGGNAGQRKYDRGWDKAVACIENPPRGLSRDSITADLKAFLDGQAYTYLKDFSAGSWFGAANKIYNHGTKRPFRKGEITPWAMALACEGLPYFAGSPSRQLGSRRQPRGAFPFVTTAMAPRGADDAGRVEAEIWVPIWKQPMTASELRSLFARGRAEIGGKGTVSSAAFAAGVMGRGVDAGLAEFRRFLLLHTTSAQTFESRLATVAPVPDGDIDDETARAIRAVVELLNVLPPDRKVGTRWRFAGVCGPLERALVDFASVCSEDGYIEQAWTLVDQVVGALSKVDRNCTFRSHNVRFQLLPGRWAMQLFREDPPDREARLALALSSLKGDSNLPQFIGHRIGVQKRARGGGRYWEFPDSAPARRVWGDTALTANLGAVAERRTMDALRLRKMTLQHPLDAEIRVDLADLQAWLSGDVDEERMRLWLDRLCVFDWSDEASDEAASELRRAYTGTRPAIDGTLALYTLLRPLASDWLFDQILRKSGIQAGHVQTCAHLGRVIAILRRGDAPAAAEAAIGAYRSAGVAIADFDTLPAVYCPERLLASLIIPVSDYQVLAVFQRWRSPAGSMRRYE